jgi:hypothetical protein
VAALLLVGGTLRYGASHLHSVAKSTRCYFELDPIRSLMAYLKDHSAPGEIVFTDDWDIFPVFFHHNTHNRYIVGLDPKFTHERRPDLWERFVRITRAQIPTTSVYQRTGQGGAERRESIDVRLEDIREHFNARYVVTDREHRSLAAKLARAPEFAELIYPCRNYADCQHAPYLLFRVRAPAESVHRDLSPDEHGRLYLSRLDPVTVEQGWGALHFDRSVEGRTLRMRDRTYARGLGTHAPSRLLFEIPPGLDEFAATVGIDDETAGAGTAVARVRLDGVEVYRSGLLTGLSEPETVRVPLKGARQLELLADDGGDGQRYDHVNWADARFARPATAAIQRETFNCLATNCLVTNCLATRATSDGGEQ